MRLTEIYQRKAFSFSNISDCKLDRSDFKCMRIKVNPKETRIKCKTIVIRYKSIVITATFDLNLTQNKELPISFIMQYDKRQKNRPL